MSEIPEDIAALAGRIDRFNTDDKVTNKIAKGIIEERGRCLLIVESIEPMNLSEAHLIETIVRRIRGRE